MRLSALLAAAAWMVVWAEWSLHAAAPETESSTWQQFVTARKRGAEPILPDFSYAAYHGGVDAIPDVKGPIFDVKKHGARGDGRADDQEAIQKAIDAAEAAGGGVVFFPPGTYRVNTDPGRRRPLKIGRGHIGLRGSGATKGGTVLFIDEPTLPKGPGPADGGEVAPDWMIRNKENPREALLKQWPTSDGKPWVEPEVKQGRER